MPHYCLELEYDGRAFSGWQAQAQGQATVQGTLIEAVERVTGERVPVTGSGRTDAGVHAEAQRVSLSLAGEWETERLLKALNGVLPRAVVVRSVQSVTASFDARRDAVGKRYRYRIWNGSVRSPLRAARQTHVPQVLDLVAMRTAAADLLGERDFACFQAAGSDVRTTVRRLSRVDVLGDPGGEVSILAEGSGFLRHMVRNLAGTLIEVGLGRRGADSMPDLLASGDRSRAGPTAPAEGLTLEEVYYAPGTLDKEGVSVTDDRAEG